MKKALLVFIAIVSMATFGVVLVGHYERNKPVEVVSEPVPVVAEPLPVTVEQYNALHTECLKGANAHASLPVEVQPNVPVPVCGETVQ